MIQLLGEFDCTMDTKGRIRLPSGLLKQLGEEGSAFVLNKGFEKHLTLYPKSVWARTIEGFSALNSYDSDSRNFLRRFHNGASPIEIDDQSRILIPKRLAEYAGMEKEVVISCYNDKIEIWDAAEHKRLMDDDSVNMSDLSDKVFKAKKE